MKFRMSRVKSLAICVVWIVAMGMIAPESRAELVAGGITRYQISPVQDLILAPGTAFNPGTEEVVLTDVAAFGFNTFDRLDQVGTTIEHINGFASGDGFHPLLGNFTLITGAPGFDPMSLVLTDVVQDPNHPGYANGDPSSIISANVVYTVPNWGVQLHDAGVSLEVRDPFSFVGTFDGLPPSNGNMIADEFIGNNDRLNVYIAGTNDLVGWSANRRLISAVPEPSSIAFLAVATVAGAYRWNKRSKTRRGQ